MYSSWIKCLLVITPLTAALTLSSCGSSPSPSPTSSPVSPAPTPVAGVLVTPTTVTVLRGQSQQFVAQVPALSDQTVTWHATPNVGTIDSTGLYTAPVDGAGFLVTITATSKVSPGRVGKAVVTLPTVTLSVAPNEIDVVPGESHAFTATVVGLTNTNVSWTVQDSGGGTITSTGFYSAPSTTGVYKVIATSSADANYNAAAVVLVTAKPSSPFSPTGNLVIRREFHTATLLADGTVLVAGGGKYEAYDTYCPAGSDFAELYDPVLGSFALISPMIDRRYAQTSTLLQNGKVLITGGFSFDTDCSDPDTSPPLASAELYDSSSGAFAPTGSMSGARGAHTATLLSTGKVLIVGGGNAGGGRPPFAGDGSATAEVYDPATGTFTPTANMSTARIGQTATLLLNGKVLIAGGITSGSSGGSPLATAELYDPLTGAFTVVGTMTAPRAGHTATVLPDGMVLITGGFTDSSQVGTDTAEIYDPAKASFLATNKPMVVGRWAHTATLLPDGAVLLVGGGSLVAETYSPTDGSFSAVGLDDAERTGHTATLLKNGSVVIIGGIGGIDSQTQTTAELYQ